MALAKQRATAGSRTKTIRLDKIRLDGDTQSRKSLDDEVIKDYSDLMADGHEFPPLDVVFDGADYWLWDGFHRRWAGIKAKVESMKCRVTEGTREDARWMSYAANKDHGWPRSHEDKRKAVESALKHPNGLKLSDSKIAEHVGVSQPTVAKYRKHVEPTSKILKSTGRIGRDGRTINTANIGKSKPESKPNGKPTVAETKQAQHASRAVEFGMTPSAAAKAFDVPREEIATATEPNRIGEAFELLDATVERLISGQPAHFVQAIKEHLQQLAEAL